jgi:hypothetical protein
VSCKKRLKIHPSVYSLAIFITYTLALLSSMCFFSKKKENRQILLRLNCASGEFFAAQLLFSESFSENNVVVVVAGKKRQQQFIVFSSLSLYIAFDKKNIVLRRKMSFFPNVFIYSAKKLLSIKMGSNFFCHPTLRTKKHISDKIFLLLFSTFLSLSLTEYIQRRR